MLEKFLSEAPSEPERVVVAFGFVPAVQWFNRDTSVSPGMLVGVDVAGKLVSAWEVHDNRAAIAQLVGQKVALPRGFGGWAKIMRDEGVLVEVHPFETDAQELARFAADDGVGWL